MNTIVNLAHFYSLTALPRRSSRFLYFIKLFSILISPDVPTTNLSQQQLSRVRGMSRWLDSLSKYMSPSPDIRIFPLNSTQSLSWFLTRICMSVKIDVLSKSSRDWNLHRNKINLLLLTTCRRCNGNKLVPGRTRRPCPSNDPHGGYKTSGTRIRLK